MIKTGRRHETLEPAYFTSDNALPLTPGFSPVDGAAPEAETVSTVYPYPREAVETAPNETVGPRTPP